MAVVYESDRFAYFQAASGSGTKADPFVPGVGAVVFYSGRNDFFQAASGSGTKADPFVLADGAILPWL